MSISICRYGATVLLLVALGARADTVADWADKTTEIATDGPNTIRTMALVQNAVYEAVNGITAHFAHDRVDVGPTEGASIDAAIAAASRAVLIHEAPCRRESRPSTRRYSGRSRMTQRECAASTLAGGQRPTCSQNTPTTSER